MIARNVKVWVATTPVDMRKSFDTLSAVVEKFLQHDPASGHLFVFRNKGGHLAKILWRDANGWTIHYKRLDEGMFHFPDDGTTAVSISREGLLNLLSQENCKVTNRAFSARWWGSRRCSQRLLGSAGGGRTASDGSRGRHY